MVHVRSGDVTPSRVAVTPMTTVAPAGGMADGAVNVRVAPVPESPIAVVRPDPGTGRNDHESAAPPPRRAAATVTVDSGSTV